MLSFEALPTETLGLICGFLQQREVCRLSLASKAVYCCIRPIFYRSVTISSFTSLALFSRTLAQATYLGKVDHKWSTKSSIDQTRYLHLTLDPTKDNAKNGGQPPPAILIARMLQAIERRCPNIEVALFFVHCKCKFTPIAALETETFPRVTRLVLYVGSHEELPASTISDRVGTRGIDCVPKTKFWRPLVNGSSFPDCRRVEVRHFWATTPPGNASLYLPVFELGINRFSTAVGSLGDCDGLETLESIVLECPPELNTSVFMQLVQNPKSMARNLKNLELRFCNLEHETIATLLHYSPPSLRRFVLLCSDFDLDPTGEHLCPLLRQFSKNLVHIEYGADTICRQLFLDDAEVKSLAQNGDVEKSTDGPLDVYAVRETIEKCRRKKRREYRNERIQEAVSQAASQKVSPCAQNSIFGGAPSVESAAARAQREVEILLDDEEAQRSRLITGSKTPWFRRIMAWNGLCSSQAREWSELMLAAELEEPGIDWVLIHKGLELASLHSNGKPSVDLDMEPAMEEHYKM